MLERFRSKFPVTDEKWQTYVSYFTRLSVPARTALLAEGEISTKAYLIEKGAIRVCFNHHGKDITSQFFFENQTVSSIESLKKSIPSRVSIETIEPSILWRIEKRNLERILEEMNEIREIRNFITDALFERTFHYMDHFLSFIRDTPEERYLKLLQDAPHIIIRVPQHYIASYLGISGVHLSRIKSKIAKKKQ
jgi:CRP-like cAMP-binding protein